MATSRPGGIRQRHHNHRNTISSSEQAARASGVPKTHHALRDVGHCGRHHGFADATRQPRDVALRQARGGQRSRLCGA